MLRAGVLVQDIFNVTMEITVEPAAATAAGALAVLARAWRLSNTCVFKVFALQETRALHRLHKAVFSSHFPK